jgi:DNA-binding response OmpR family regulator
MNPNQFHILLIEDNPDHAILINEILKQIKEITKITLIDDGQKALDFMTKAKHKKQVPNLVLLDLKLPKISGLELLKKWKEDRSFAHLPIIVLSTSDIEKDKKSALSLGAGQYLVKPSNYDSLYKQIRKIVNQILKKKPHLVNFNQ